MSDTIGSRSTRSRTTKFYVLLLIIFVIYCQTSAAVPVTRSGRRLLLHTRQSRERDHQLLIQQLRSQQPPHSASHRHHHHLHLRSVPATQPSPNMASKCQLCSYLQQAKCALEGTYRELLSSLSKFEMKPLFDEAMGKQNSELQFPVAHSYREALGKIDINNEYSLPLEDFAHLRRPSTHKQITEELLKVRGSMIAIRQLLEESLAFQEASLVQNSEPYRHNKDFEKISNWTRQFLIQDVVTKLAYLDKALGPAEEHQYEGPRDQFNNIYVGVREYFRLLKFQKALYVFLGSNCEMECSTAADCRDSEKHI